MTPHARRLAGALALTLAVAPSSRASALPASCEGAGAPERCRVAAARRPAPDARWTPADTTRPRAVQVSDAYARRLAIHRYASYAMLPLFATQYVLGDRLIDQKDALYAGRRTEPVGDGLRGAHVATAIGVATLFTVNTVTGLWNLYDGRGTTEGRGIRTAHTVLMLLADAGFVATGVVGNRATEHGPSEARQHRDVALGAMSVAAVGATLMWLRR